MWVSGRRAEFAKGEKGGPSGVLASVSVGEEGARAGGDLGGRSELGQGVAGMHTGVRATETVDEPLFKLVEAQQESRW